jgi:structure-specific recognition protein 1
MMNQISFEITYECENCGHKNVLIDADSETTSLKDIDTVMKLLRPDFRADSDEGEDEDYVDEEEDEDEEEEDEEVEDEDEEDEEEDED